MSKQHTSKSTLFLMELMIVIFFFSICAAICINIFGSAQQMAKDSYNLSNAVMVARSAASCYKSAEGDIIEAVSLLDSKAGNDKGVVYYDQKWQQVEELNNNGFYLKIERMQEYGEANIEVRQAKDNAMLFQLNVKSSRGGGQHGT